MRNFNGGDKTRRARREIDNRQPRTTHTHTTHRAVVKCNELAIRLLMTKSPTVQNSPAAHISRAAFIANPGVYRRDFPEMGKRPDYYDAELMIPGIASSAGRTSMRAKAIFRHIFCNCHRYFLSRGLNLRIF